MAKRSKKVKQEVANILEVFAEATPQELAEGVAWYPCAFREAQGMARRHDLAVETAVGVVAALSPRNKWDRNLLDAENLLSALAKGENPESVRVCTFAQNKAKAIKIAKEGLSDPAEIRKVLSGPKLQEFFSCILGDSKESCIDGHAFAVWSGKRIVLADVGTISKTARIEIKSDYAKAGEILGFPASVIQAVTWVAWRRMHGIV